MEKEYVHRVDQWEWLPGVSEAIRELNRLGLKVVVVSNQAGIARGLYTERDVRRLQAWVEEGLARRGGAGGG